MEIDNLSLFREIKKSKTKPPTLFSDAHKILSTSSDLVEKINAEMYAEEVQLAKQSAITKDNVSIIALSGQDLTDEEVSKKLFWETDQYPNLESNLLYYEFNPINGKASWFGGETKLWNYLSETADQIVKERALPLDIYNLTPTEAVFLVKELVRRRLKYDDIVANDIVTQNKIDEGKVSTARPELLDYFSSNPKKFQYQSSKYSTDLSYKTADQIIDHGYGVCRHIAAVSSILYEVLRNKQESILMNGSYLIYHNEHKGSQNPKASIGSHAYNILYTTRPTEEGNPEVYISVLDPTRVAGSDWAGNDMDYTWLRISQACSSLYEYGHLFNVENNKQVVESLAKKACLRFRKYIFHQNPKFEETSREFGVESYLNDYISLELQSGPRETGKILDSVFCLYDHYNKSRADMLVYLLQNHPMTYEAVDDNLYIWPEWFPELVHQLRKTELSRKRSSDRKLLDILTFHANEITTELLATDKSGYYMEFLTIYHNICKKF